MENYHIISNMEYSRELCNEADTLALGAAFAKSLQSGAFIALRGELGAGKTVFVKGLAQALGVRERVTSPTFTVMCQYFGTRQLCHFDLYRVTEDDCYALGFDDFFFDPTVISAVEWSERLTDLPKNAITLTLTKTGENTRRAEISDPAGLLKEFL